MSHRGLLVGLLAAVFGPCVVLAQQPKATPRPTRCNYNSDRLSSDSVPGVGQIVFLGGHVVIHCPERGIVLHGDSAEHYPDHDQMVRNASAEDPRLHVTADFLNYFPTDDRVVAAGNVHGQTAGGSTLVGPQAEYRRIIPKIRPREQMSAVARPTITVVQRDSTGKLAPP